MINGPDVVIGKAILGCQMLELENGRLGCGRCRNALQEKSRKAIQHEETLWHAGNH
jgi:hypothetical protein